MCIIARLIERWRCESLSLVKTVETQQTRGRVSGSRLPPSTTSPSPSPSPSSSQSPSQTPPDHTFSLSLITETPAANPESFSWTLWPLSPRPCRDARGEERCVQRGLISLVLPVALIIFSCPRGSECIGLCMEEVEEEEVQRRLSGNELIFPHQLISSFLNARKCEICFCHINQQRPCINNS